MIVKVQEVITNDSFIVCFILVGCLVLLDIITGLMQAVKNKNFKSSKMREGLFNKTKVLVTIVFGVVIDSFGGSIIAIPISVPIMCYIALMEISSINENYGLLLPKDVKKMLEKESKEDVKS